MPCPSKFEMLPTSLVARMNTKVKVGGFDYHPDELAMYNHLYVFPWMVTHIGTLNLAV